MTNHRDVRLLLRRLTPIQWLWAGIGFLVAVMAMAWAVHRSSSSAYVTAPVTRGNLTVAVHATGTLAPRNQVDVGAEVSGKIDTVAVDFNSPVRKGQVLAKLDTLSFEAALAQSRAALAQAQATLGQAEQTFHRATALLKGGAASRQDVDTAKADYLRAQAGVNLARAQVNSNETTLGKATIYAPIDGVVLDRRVSAGQTVAAAMTTPVLFTLASDLKEMELDADIAQADVGLLKPGAKAAFTVDAYPGRRFAARLTAIHNAPRAVGGNVTYRGVLLVENPERLLKPGMTAIAEIGAASLHDVLLVPNAALHFTPDDSQSPPHSRGRIWTEAAGRLVAHDIALGPTDGRMTAIAGGGLKPGDAVVTGER